VTCGVTGCSRGGLLAWSRVERGHTPTYPGGIMVTVTISRKRG
jgi:hypothetical protein